MKNCENCKIEHDGKYGSGRFCSEKCAKSFSTKFNRIRTNLKISSALKGKPSKNKKPTIKKICQYCKHEFEVIPSYKHQKFCSRTCSDKGQKRNGWSVCHNKLNKEDWSRINKKSYATGNNFVAGGTTKWYNYKNIKVQGTYELRACAILDKLKELKNILDWEYTNDKIQYIGSDNKIHTYLLDFKIFNTDGSFYYIEVKGYEKENDKLKWHAVKNAGYTLIVWFNDKLIEYEKTLNIQPVQ